MLDKLNCQNGIYAIDLQTISKGMQFKYIGSVESGTTIIFGNDRKVFVTNKEWSALLNTFSGRQVRIGASRTNPPTGSLGEWLISNVTAQAIASYIAPILIHQGFAKQVGKFDIQLNNSSMDDR